MAVGFSIDTSLNPVYGTQLYEVAPLAVNTVLPPSQIFVLPEITITGKGFTIIVTVDVEEQFPVVPVTV